MTSRRRLLTATALAAGSALVLAGCATAGTDAGTADAGVSIVTSTNVYAQIAEEIGGDLVTVTPIIDSAAADPHSFEPSARDQLTVSTADLIIENGGGYDAFVDSLIAASGTEAPVLTAVEFSDAWTGDAAHDDSDADDDGHDHVEGFNEHVWYDPHAMAALAQGIAAQLETADPGNAATYAANADAFVAEVGALETSLGAVASAHDGAGVFATEPVGLYLLEAAGLSNLTPDAFSQAVEEGSDVPPATLLEALTILESGEVAVVVANSQTGGVETDEVIDVAGSQDIPVVEFTETLPTGQTYISWMQANVDALSGALGE